ncbi:MAG: hypothetical protein Q8O67_33330 [Deltaproteobacteria bacterium]|nr:hypothetical protein [Deltaproteobacteria bacterium]
MVALVNSSSTTRPVPSLPGLREARAHGSPAARLRATRDAAHRARRALLDDGPVAGIASCKLVTFPYPTQYAFQGMALSPAPFVMMTNRMHVVRFIDHAGVPRVLLFNPSDYERNQTTPFFAKLRKKYGDFLADKVLAQRHGGVDQHLMKLELDANDVDYVAYDHLHTQDVRRWLGSSTSGDRSLLPRAKLLVHKDEWRATKDMHPMQTPWYCPQGTDGVDDDRVQLLDDDLWLGKGVALVLTPGHTAGNMSLCVTTSKGVAVVSENGVAAECYAPQLSRIAGLRVSAARMTQEVVLNANTREGSLEQYTSMILERDLAQPNDGGDVPLFFPSSELTSHPIAAGLSPTVSHGELSL